MGFFFHYKLQNLTIAISQHVADSTRACQSSENRTVRSGTSSTIYHLKVRLVVGKGKLASYATPPLSPVADNFSSFRLAQEASHIGRRGMEGDDPFRRQYEHPNYHQTFPPNMRSRSIADPSGTDIDDIQNIQDTPRSGPTQRFRQTQLLGQQTPTSIAMPAGGGQAQVSSGYGFGQGQYYTTTQHVQGNPLHYQPDYGQDPHRQQQFTGYTSQIMQSVPQQVQAQSSYDNLPQFQPRQSAALELSNQFSGTQYYNTSQSTSASVPASMPQQYASINYQPQTPYQPNPFMNRPSIPQQTLPPTPVMAEVPQADPPEPEEQPTQTWEREFDDRIREINHHISDNRLSEAAPLLLELSQWLLGRVSEFGRI